MTKKGNRRSRYKSKRVGHKFRNIFNYGRVYNHYGNEVKFVNPRFETTLEEVTIQIPLSEESHYEAHTRQKTEPISESTHMTTEEPKKSGLGRKFWVGVALAGIAAAGVGIFIFNKKQ